MPSADVVVVGSGLAGLVAANALARRGARVIVVANGTASTYWIPGSIDVAAPPGAAKSREGVERLGARRGHPYATLGRDVEPALDEVLALLEAGGLPYSGGLDTPIAPAPTAIGSTRPIAVAPLGQAAALEPWTTDETLVVCGIDGFKDFWPRPVASNLSHPRIWGLPHVGSAPARVIPVIADLGVAGRHNLTALHLARSFDAPEWRRRAIGAIRRAVETARPRPPARMAVPAVLGLRDHAAVLDELTAAAGMPVFEIPLVPPSIPGIRLHETLREALRKAGGRIQLGESVSGFERSADRVTAVTLPAAVREYRVRAGAVVLASGGLAGGGIVARPDGRLEETVLGLRVEQPRRDDWFEADPFDPKGHPIEAAGIRTDDELRPIDADGRPTFDNVRIAGALLAGQHWLRERCGEGVAIASAYRAAASLATDGFRPGPPLPATSDTTSSAAEASAPAGWGPI